MAKKSKTKLGRPPKKNKKKFVTINVSPSTKAKWVKLRGESGKSLDSVLSGAADKELLELKAKTIA